MSEPEQKKKPRWRYKLQLLSERHDRVVFTFSMPLWLTAVVAVLLIMATALFALFIATTTPLRSYLPGYLDMNKRAVVVESAMRIDSIARESQQRAMYLENMISILSDKNIRNDRIERYDSVAGQIKDSILAASDREQEFVARYEEQERFGLNAVSKESQLSAVSFINVTKGKVVVPDDPEDVDPLLGVRVVFSREMPVLSPLESTVVMARYIIGSGYEVVLQCANDYIAVLSHLSSVMVDEGRLLKAGQVVGHAGAQKEMSDKWISIRIWHKGKPIDPTTLMEF